MVMESRPAKSMSVVMGRGLGTPVPNIRVKMASFVTDAVTFTKDVAKNLGIKTSVSLLAHTLEGGRVSHGRRGGM